MSSTDSRGNGRTSASAVGSSPPQSAQNRASGACPAAQCGHGVCVRSEIVAFSVMRFPLSVADGEVCAENVRGDRERQAFYSGTDELHLVDADDRSVAVHQRAAAVAGVD